MHQDKLTSIKPLAKNNKKLQAKGLSKKKSLDENRILKVKITCNHSEELPIKYFSNKVAGKDLNTPIRSHISEILKLDGNSIQSNQLHLEIEDTLCENKKDKDRVPDILNLYGVTFEKEKISKCRYRNDYSIMQKVNKDLLRFFVKYEEGTIDIVLIDPHHLLATENYKEMFQVSKAQCKYCFSCLKNIDIYR